MSLPLSPQRLHEKFHLASLHAAASPEVSPFLRDGQETVALGGQAESSDSATNSEVPRPPPTSELDFIMIDAGEPLLSGYAVPPNSAPQEEGAP